MRPLGLKIALKIELLVEIVGLRCVEGALYQSKPGGGLFGKMVSEAMGFGASGQHHRQPSRSCPGFRLLCRNGFCQQCKCAGPCRANDAW